jgi:hypothetical protein
MPYTLIGSQWRRLLPKIAIRVAHASGLDNRIALNQAAGQAGPEHDARPHHREEPRMSRVTAFPAPPAIRLEVEVPAGWYFVGDPGYFIPTDAWMGWLDAADSAIPSRDHVLAANVDGLLAVGVSTAHGDGVYRDQEGREYGVDAGLIGVVPEAVAEAATDSTYASFKANGKDADALGLGRVIEFECPFTARYEDGVVVLGSLRIDTTDDADEDCDL